MPPKTTTSGNTDAKLVEILERLDRVESRLIENEPILELHEMANMTGQSQSTLMNELRSGRLVGFKLSGSWRAYRSEVSKYIKRAAEAQGAA